MLEILNLKELIPVIEEKMKADKLTSFDDKRKKEEIEKIYKREQDLKLMATDGSEEAREFTRNKIYFLLMDVKEIGINNINSIIEQYHINYFKNIYTDDKSSNLKKPIDSDIEEYFQKFSISKYDSFEKKLFKLAQIIYQELYGYSVLDELVFDSELNEVACNRYDYIWIQYNGVKRRIPNSHFKFISEEFYRNVVENRITSTAKEEMNAGEPIVYATLLNGYRITALRPPLSKYVVVNIRLFTYKSSRARKKLLPDIMMNLVSILSKKGRRNIGIIGEQGSGKTTSADDIVIRNFDDDLSLGLAENIHELNVSQNYPNKNAVELQYLKKYKPSDITEIFFRLNRDVVIYGEVRSAEEALEVIKAMLRQARGSLFTFHSSSVKRMIHDFRQLLMQTGYYTDYREAQFDIADAVDIVIHIKLDRDTGERFVFKISEVVAIDETMSYEIRDLFVYNKENRKYLVNKQGLSKVLIDSCLEYETTHMDVKALNNLFTINEENEQYFEYMS